MVAEAEEEVVAAVEAKRWSSGEVCRLSSAVYYYIALYDQTNC